jgi:hypothetical protein
MFNSYEAYKNFSDLNLWLKVRAGDKLLLSDVQEIIPLRWTYFKQEWNFIENQVREKAESYINPDELIYQTDKLSGLIEFQRNSNKNVNPFSDISTVLRYYAVFDNIDIDSINLTNNEISIIEAKISRVSAFSKNDFVNIKKSLQDLRDATADSCGLSDTDYNLAKGRNSAPAQLDPTISIINDMIDIQRAISTVDSILSNLFAVDNALNPFSLAISNANNPDVNIGQYNSGNLVKFNYGDTLEDVARKHLGDPNKWIDLAIANGLKAPYIDEVGEGLKLISNGSGSKINISGRDVTGKQNISKLYINQYILIQSSMETFPDQRSIVDIIEVPISGEIIIELDGEKNLDKFKAADEAYIRVYKPNTINSSNYILIPSLEKLEDNRIDETPWFLNKSAADEKNAKIDLSIAEDGDITFSSSGDLRLSYGLDNAIQALKLKIITELGNLPYHKNFGLLSVIGESTRDISEIKQKLIENVVNQVEVDPRFDRVEQISVDNILGNDAGASGITMSIVVKMAGSDTKIPISFSVNY